MVQLTFNPDSATSWVVSLKEGENTVGQAEDNDVRVDDCGVSGHHCRVSVSQGLVTITDLNSTNGTHLNGSRVTQAAWAPGQVVMLGQVPVRLDGQAPSRESGNGSPVRLRMTGHAAFPTPDAMIEVPPAGAASLAAAAVPVAGICGRLDCQTPARWGCPRCRKFFCDRCVTTRDTPGGTICVCRGCRIELFPAVAGPDVEPSERSFSARIPDAFAYPIRGAGVLILLAATVVFSALSAISSIFTILLMVLATGYWFLFLQSIIHSTAAGDDNLPPMPEFNGLFSAFFTLAGTVAMSFILPLGLGIAKLNNVDIPTSAFVGSIFISLLYFPMAFLAAAMLDSVAAANPLVVIPSILKIPRPYLVAVILLFGVFGIRLLGDAVSSWAGSLTFSTVDMGVLFVALGLRALWSFASLYLLTVGMRILGLLYLTQQTKLGWLSDRRGLR